MDSLESLKQIANYRENAEEKYFSKSIFRFGGSTALTLEGEKIVALAPRRWFEHLIAWVSPSQAKYEDQGKLKEVIKNNLVKIGINENDANTIMTRVVGEDQNRSITRRDLRKIIKLVENVRGFSLKPENKADPVRAVVEENPISGEENFRDIDPESEKQATMLIQNSRELLGEVTFNPQEVIQLREKVEKCRTDIDALLNTKPILNDRERFQLEEQSDHLIIKEKMLSDYLKRDPFSDKNVLYPRKIYAEAAKVIFEKKFNEIDEGERNKFEAWYRAEVSSYEGALPDRRSHLPEFYLNKNNEENPLIKYQAQRVFKEFPGWITSVSDVEQAAATVMNERFEWETIESKMIFSLGEKKEIYHQVSTPLSQTKTAVGDDLKTQMIHGMIPSVRDDGRAPINVRMTQLFKLQRGLDNQSGTEVTKKILLHERQQHGINDHYAILDAGQREEANNRSMKQLVQSGIEADVDFIQDAIANTDPQNPHQVFYINTNLTTPTWTPRGNKNDEYTYSENQAAAMKATEGKQKFSVLKSHNEGQKIDIEAKVTCIDFRFPVNYATSGVIEDWRAIDPGMMLAWPNVMEHNQAEFRKLCGSVDCKAPIGGLLGPTYEKLDSKSTSSNDEEATLKHEIQTQVEYLRKMFQLEAYKRAEEDRFKMSRHIDLLVNAFRRASELVDNHKIRVVNAGGCMSGKDREGVANAENEAAVIIQDLGGKVEPNEGGRYDQETQAIYDYCMTGVVSNTRQVTTIGGSKNAKEISKQLHDPHARVYAEGGSRFVSA